MKRLCSLIRYAWRNQKIPIVLALFVLLFVFGDFMSGWGWFDSFKARWNNDLDQVVSFATLMVALFVWLDEIRDNWKNNLPKRLTVRFEDEHGKLVLLCRKAHLSDAADIRPLGQQIASQMCGVQQLPFRVPYVKQLPETILIDDPIGCFLHYEVSFTLTKRPPAPVTHSDDYIASFTRKPDAITTSIPGLDEFASNYTVTLAKKPVAPPPTGALPAIESITGVRVLDELLHNRQYKLWEAPFTEVITKDIE
jgi:hypothetical protein